MSSATSTQYEVPSPPSDMISAVRYWPKDDDSVGKLLVSSWDRHLYLYDTSSEGSAKILHSYEHAYPILDVAWGSDDQTAYTCSIDHQVRKVNLQNGEQETISTHEAGAFRLAFDRENKILISASWDLTLHVHHTDQTDKSPSIVKLPEKPFAISASKTYLVVAMADRNVHIYDLKALALLSNQNSDPVIDVEPFQRRESSLKFMTRAVECMPNDAGYACSSIEGRVAVEWFDASEESQKRKYAFKCHRQPGPGLNEDGVEYDLVYPVHALAFHPSFGTFASGGGDGVLAIWDALAKRRVRQYQKYPTSVGALSFSADGKRLAVGVTPGLEDDNMDEILEGGGPFKVFVRDLQPEEAKGKATK